MTDLKDVFMYTSTYHGMLACMQEESHTKCTHVHLAAVLILAQDNFDGIRIFIIISYESIAFPVVCEVSYSIHIYTRIYNTRKGEIYTV